MHGRTASSHDRSLPRADRLERSGNAFLWRHSTVTIWHRVRLACDTCHVYPDRGCPLRRQDADSYAPAFTIVAVLTLALGIGANTAIFSLMDQVLLRLLPVTDPRELVQLDGPGTFRGRTANARTFSYPMYRDLRDRNDVFTGLVARGPATATFTYRGQTERVNVKLISGNTFAVLGVQPMLGRALTDDDDRAPGAHPVAVLSYGYWQRRFALDRVHPWTGITNQQHADDGRRHLAPNDVAGIVSAAAPDVFVPIMMKAEIHPTCNGLDIARAVA